MKKMFNWLIAISAFAATGLIADTDSNLEDIGSQNIQEDTSGSMFSLEISGDYISKAKFKCSNFGDFTFALGDIDFSCICYYNPCLQEGLSIGASYSRVRLDWDQNPFFTQKDYNVASINLSAFSKRLDDWIWRAQVSINFDNLDYWNFNDYMNYDLLLWGRYECASNFGIHFGILAFTGMKIDRVYPVIGFDWTYDCHWKVNVIFPMDISLVYSINHAWSVSLAGRFFNERHRVKKDQFFSEGLWFYTSSGAEFAINYTPTKWITANIHAGGDFGGHIKVANRHYHDGHRLRFGAAPYAGAEVDINF